MTERPTYVKPLDNGSLGLCSEADAHGIAYEGEVYHLNGKPAIENAETIVLAEVDAGKITSIDQAAIAANSTAIDNILVTMLEG